jgi:hypothetical protein
LSNPLFLAFIQSRSKKNQSYQFRISIRANVKQKETVIYSMMSRSGWPFMPMAIILAERLSMRDFRITLLEDIVIR